MRIVFFGTPDFATPPLLALIGEGHEVIAVVTQPDKPRGRSRTTLDPSPVKVVALDESIPVLQPLRPRGDADFAAQFRALTPDLSVVVAYGQILPQEIIDMPRLGTLNIHASLLPKHRGAAPIQAAIRDGDTETGVSIMQMVPALDAGAVLLTLKTPIEPDETAGELQLRLAELGAQALIEALVLIGIGKATPTPQNDALSSYAKKIVREDARLPFDGPSERAARFVRAYDPKPGAWGVINGVEVRCFGAQSEAPRSGAPGEIVEAGDRGIVIACGAGSLRVAEVHPAGQKRLAAAQWVRGRGVKVGDRFEG